MENSRRPDRSIQLRIAEPRKIVEADGICGRIRDLEFNLDAGGNRGETILNAGECAETRERVGSRLKIVTSNRAAGMQTGGGCNLLARISLRTCASDGNEMIGFGFRFLRTGRQSESQEAAEEKKQMLERTARNRDGRE